MDMGSSALYGLLVSAGCINGIGQIMMRAGGKGAAVGELLTVRGGLAHPVWSAGLMICWVCGLFWAWLVPKAPLMTAIPTYVGVCFLTVALGSVAALGEPMRMREGIGSVLVLAGIALLARR